MMVFCVAISAVPVRAPTGVPLGERKHDQLNIVVVLSSFFKQGKQGSVHTHTHMQ